MLQRIILRQLAKKLKKKTKTESVKLVVDLKTESTFINDKLLNGDLSEYRDQVEDLVAHYGVPKADMLMLEDTPAGMSLSILYTDEHGEKLKKHITL